MLSDRLRYAAERLISRRRLNRLIEWFDPFDRRGLCRGLADRLAAAESARVLDAGSGEGHLAREFDRPGLRWVGIDAMVGDGTWDYSSVTLRGDLARLPLADARFDAAVSLVTLEHVPDPLAVLREMHRVLRPDGIALIAAPFLWEMHQQPHDYFRFSAHGLCHLLEQAGFEIDSIRPASGFPLLLGMRLLNLIGFCQSGWRWLLMPLAAPLGLAGYLLGRLLDPLDRDPVYTLGWVVWARATRTGDDSCC